MRLAVPLMAGIAVASFCDVAADGWALLFLASLLLMVAGLFVERLRLLFGVGSLSAMFFMGGVVQQKDAATMAPQWDETKGNYSAVFLETPRMGDKSVKALVMLTREDGDTLASRSSGVAYLYFANCVAAENFRIGGRVVFTGKVRNPENNGNPAEFDNKRYLYNKGVTGTAYLPVGGWSEAGEAPMTLRMRALALRERVVQLYARMGFDEEVRPVLSALTIGDKSELSREIKETFSSVGAGHILALSGLHLGIFYMILSVLLPAWRSRRLYVVLREAAIVAVIWLFAFVAGLSPSIVRAATLFTLFSVGRCIRRDSYSVNALSFAAIAILIVSPRSLFDVGFQLSFASVFSILMLYRPVRALLGGDTYGAVYSYFADIVAISLVAQVGTLPFLCHYFGAFPTYFLLTNIVVVPLAFVIMALAVLLWATFAIPFLGDSVAWVLNGAVSLMNGAVGFIDGLPFSSLLLPYVDAVSAWGVALFILFLICAIRGRRRVLFASMAVAALFATFSRMWYLHNDSRGDYILIYNSSKCPAVQLVVSRDCSYMLSTKEQRFAELEYVTEPYLRRESFATPVWVNGDYADSLLVVTEGLIKFRGRSMQLLQDGNWEEIAESQQVDILYLCKGFKGRMESVLEKFPAGQVVMDAGLHYMSRRRVARECQALGQSCIDISQTGALFFYCDEDSMPPHYCRK